ncbi:MAG: acyl--CoA ligase [Acidimicrobiia bacterium]|nr:acyl--CoA ligase [Acidimicrobiia bacterium]
MVTETVGRTPMRVFRKRLGSLREIGRRAIARGDRPAVVAGTRRLTYAELFRAVNGVSRELAARGVGKGDRVAILSANNLEWIVTFWAAVDLGAVAVGLNGWWTGDEILHALQDSGAKLLVADTKRLERILGKLDAVPELRHILVIGRHPDGTGGQTVIEEFDVLWGEAGDEFPVVEIDEDDPAVILYTSGTTGRAKGAVATHRSWIASIDNTTALAAARKLAADSPHGDARPAYEVALVTVPFFHVAGGHTHLVMGILAGWTLVLLEGRFDAGEALRLIEEEKVTRWTAVPTMIRRVVDDPAIGLRDTSTLHTMAWGGAPAPPELRDDVRRAIPSLKEGELGNAYGLTETSSAVTFHGERGSGLKPASVGRAVFCVDIRIADAGGGPVPAGEAGEIQVRGPMVFAGYWNNPAATEAVFDDGWFRTGDVGYLDPDGYLFVTDRMKDVVIRGGENVYCVEIEDRLVAHPDVLDAAVVGVPHADLGEEVKAVVQVRVGSTLDEAGVREWVRSTLASFKVPSIVEVRTEPLPRNAAGKLLKTVLRNPAGETGFVETL